MTTTRKPRHEDTWVLVTSPNGSQHEMTLTIFHRLAELYPGTWATYTVERM